MELDALKLKLIQWVVRQDQPTVLRELDKMISGMEKTSEGLATVVGYRSQGTSVTLASLIRQIKSQEASDNTITLSELEQQSENW